MMVLNHAHHNMNLYDLIPKSPFTNLPEPPIDVLYFKNFINYS